MKRVVVILRNMRGIHKDGVRGRGTRPLTRPHADEFIVPALGLAADTALGGEGETDFFGLDRASFNGSGFAATLVPLHRASLLVSGYQMGKTRRGGGDSIFNVGAYGWLILFNCYLV